MKGAIFDKKNAVKHIASVQNPVVKHLAQLQEKSRLRKQSGTFIIEGYREIKLALQGKYIITEVFIDVTLFDTKQIENLLPAERVVTISREVYKKLAYRADAEGILAVAKAKNHELEELTLTKNPLLLIAEAPEKPGNIGALLRTADAAKLDAVLIANPKTDLYNPNIIRSSVGCLFTVPVAVGSTAQILAFLAEKQINLYAAALQNASPYDAENYNRPTAIAVGTEDLGLSETWRQAAVKNIIIPMQGAIDSMNVSTAAAVLIFEAKRQRGFK